jgi:hypothetical protein
MMIGTVKPKKTGGKYIMLCLVEVTAHFTVIDETGTMVEW